MYAPFPRQYIHIRGNLNMIFFLTGWSYFCQMNKIVAGSMLVMMVEMREECIGLFVAKLR
jgi:hypothetical protein